MATGKAKALKKSARTKIGFAVALALLDRGLTLTGFTNFWLGATLQLLAFGFAVWAFWLWELVAHWRTRSRVLTAILVGGLYLGLLSLQIPKGPPPFILRHKGAFVFSDFPQPLLYKYGGPTPYLAPVGLAINIEVTNNRQSKTKITQYTADIQTSDGNWFRVLSLPMVPPHEIYFLNLRDIRRAFKCTFPPGIFDPLAAEKVLDSGEPIEGWMFYEWPLELRHKTVLVKEVKITLKNSQGESTETVFGKGLVTAEPGASDLDQQGLFRGENEPEVDLSNIPIKPLRDH